MVRITHSRQRISAAGEAGGGVRSPGAADVGDEAGESRTPALPPPMPNRKARMRTASAAAAMAMDRPLGRGMRMATASPCLDEGPRRGLCGQKAPSESEPQVYDYRIRTQSCTECYLRGLSLRPPRGSDVAHHIAELPLITLPLSTKRLPVPPARRVQRTDTRPPCARPLTQDSCRSPYVMSARPELWVRTGPARQEGLLRTFG